MAICAVGGMLVLGGGFLLAGDAAFTVGGYAITGGVQASIIGAASGAAVGVTFGINYPMVFGTLTQWTSDLLSQKMVRGKSNFEHVKTVSEIKQEASVNRAISEQTAPKLTLAKDAAPSTMISDIHAEGRQAPALELVKR